eukprot:gene306-2399_t
MFPEDGGAYRAAYPLCTSASTICHLLLRLLSNGAPADATRTIVLKQ